MATKPTIHKLTYYNPTNKFFQEKIQLQTLKKQGLAKTRTPDIGFKANGITSRPSAMRNFKSERKVVLRKKV